jgi:hypothetical protein
MLLHESGAKLGKWFKDWALEAFVVLPIVTVFFLLFVGFADRDSFAAGATALVALSPLWLPWALAIMFWVLWIDYIRTLHWIKFERVLLQVEIPPEVEKSPLAMEVFFHGIFNDGSETTFIDRFWKGRTMPTWSFEIASNEGSISYYIQCPKLWKNFVEARLYGQYPEAKITEVEDYTRAVDYNGEEWDAWVGEYRKTTKDTHAYPIKTYIDYELDKNTDTPEIKVDPLTHILEIMNGVGKDEYLWVQFILKAYKSRSMWYGIIFDRDEFKESARRAIEKIVKDAVKRAKNFTEDPNEQKKVGGNPMMLLTDDEKSAIAAIERSMGKAVFEVGVRGIYVAKKDRFYGITGAPMFRLFETFRSPYTELKGTRGMVGFDYPWEDLAGMRKAHIKRQQIQFYKQRAYFFVPYDQAPVHMTVEEVASLWHFPGSAVKTPGLARVATRRADAPPNLPTKEK